MVRISLFRNNHRNTYSPLLYFESVQEEDVLLRKKRVRNISLPFPFLFVFKAFPEPSLLHEPIAHGGEIFMSDKKDFGLWETVFKFGSPIVLALLKTLAEKVFSSFF